MTLRLENESIQNRAFAGVAKAGPARVQRKWTGQDVLALLGGLLSLGMALWLTFSGGVGLAILFWIAAWMLLRSLSRRSWGVLDRLLPDPRTPEEGAAARERMRREEMEEDFFREGDPGIMGTAAWSMWQTEEQMLKDD